MAATNGVPNPAMATWSTANMPAFTSFSRALRAFAIACRAAEADRNVITEERLRATGRNLRVEVERISRRPVPPSTITASFLSSALGLYRRALDTLAVDPIDDEQLEHSFNRACELWARAMDEILICCGQPPLGSDAA